MKNPIRATFVNTAWLTVLCCALVSQVVASAIVIRYGQWMYTTATERVWLQLFFASAAVLAGLIGGLLVWVVLWFTGWAASRIARRWLVAVAILSSGIWIGAMIELRPVLFFWDRKFLFCAGLSFLCGLAAARGRRPWLFADVFILLAVSVGVLGVGIWANLRFIRQADSLLSGLLNTTILFGALIAASSGLVFVSHARWRRHTEDAGGQKLHRVSAIGLVALGLGAVAAFGPLHRLAASGQYCAERTRVAGPSPDIALPTESVDDFEPLVRNLVLISVDTLRADHLGIYGYEVPTSPRIDSFFAGGVVFRTAFSQAPWTLPSHMSMILGQYPSSHGVQVYPQVTRGFIDRLPDSAVTVAELLGEAGFKTGGFTADGFLSREYAFDQGFHQFGEAESLRMAEVLDMALPWLKDNAESRFFLFLHSFDVHRYNPSVNFNGISDHGYQGHLKRVHEQQPDNLENLAVGDGFYTLDSSDVAYLEFLYDSEIRTVDDQLGRLFGELEDLHVLDRTAVILTSDHGESFLEHGATGHAFTMYNEALHVPLLVRGPGLRQPEDVLQRVQTIDIAPTITDLLGLPISAKTTMQGDSLAPALLGQILAARPILCEADALDTQAALIDGKFKYISYGIPYHDLFDSRFIMLTMKGLVSPYAKKEELFNLEDDPDERVNLAPTNPECARAYRESLMRRIRDLRRVKTMPGTQPIMSDELEMRLRALGYVH